MDAIVVNNFVKNYGNFRAVDDISFTVKMGEIFGLIGPNGSGKTTTLRSISTLIQINGGSISVFGHDVATDASNVRKIISYLPEDAGAYKNLTGKAYLQFIAGFFKEENKNVADIVAKGVEIADLGEKINNRVDTYSKGMMRRLLIGRALMIEPKLAILDEPTSGLDVINAKEIRDLIKNAVKKGLTVLLSSHNMLEVEFLCDRIALIDHGKIVEFGEPQTLKKKYEAANIEEVFTKVVA